jgi:hypothetical protein
MQSNQPFWPSLESSLEGLTSLFAREKREELWLTKDHLPLKIDIHVGMISPNGEPYLHNHAIINL